MSLSMRSLIKGHRRSDSSTSDLGSPLDTASIKPPPPKSTISPVLPCLPLHMTPPQTFGGLNQSSMSSPKKLLTPIIKMFGHHGKNGNISTTVDTLNSVVFGEFEPPKGRKPIGANSMTNLSDLKNIPSSNSSSPKIHNYRSLSLLEVPSLIKFDQLINPHPSKSNKSLENWSEGLRGYNEKPIQFDLRIDSEIAESTPLEQAIPRPSTSLDSDRLLPFVGSIGVTLKNDSETLYEADDDLRDSDASSEFSFVKDMVGGRNTSIKYYKTKSQMKKAQPHHSYSEMDDLVLEDEYAHSDYDFDNNGLDDDDDFGDDCFEANDRFNDFLSEDSAPNTAVNQLSFKPPALNLNNDSTSIASSNNSGHEKGSFQTGSPTCGPDSPSISDLRSPGYGVDFLDSYLDKTRLPMPTTSRSLNLTSPLENQTVESSIVSDHKNILNPSPLISEKIESTGSNIFPRNDKRLASNISQSRNSITNIMGILANLETEPIKNDQPAGDLSVTNIMGILEKLEDGEANSARNQNQSEPFSKVKDSLTSLEKTVSAASPEAKAQMRQSIADMMNTLSILDTHLERKNTSTKYKKKMSTKPFRKDMESSKERYSWINDSEKIGPVLESSFDENVSETLNGSIDQDLIDEINMVPEDFDFDVAPLVSVKQVSSFYRSNSYNKRPEKIVQDFNYQDNKIQTALKTVTFYRGNSEHSLNVVPSRFGSNKSMTSFTSVEDHDYDLKLETKSMNMPTQHIKSNQHNVHVSSPLYFMSSDSISRRSENLEPIDESDLASI